MSEVVQRCDQVKWSLKGQVKALDANITHEVGRLGRGLEGTERQATDKFVGELRSLRDQTQAHVNAISSVVREGVE
jgi:hypothetical protein